MEDKNKFIEEAKQNARKISSEIQELSSIDVKSKDTFAKYRDKSQSVLGLFKNLKPLLKEDRENLWNTYQQLTNNQRQKQEERKRSKTYASTRKKEVVIGTINDAKTYASGNLDSLKRAEELLKTARERMRSGWSEGFGVAEAFFHASDGKMTKEDLDHCWQYWNEVKEKIKSRRNEIFSDNYHNIKEEINPISELAVYGDPYEAMKRIKLTRSKVFSHPMAHEGKESILRALDEWGRKATERINEKKKDNELKRKEWEAKKAENLKKQKEWELRKIEKEKKHKEWERKQKEWEERQKERERKQREWEERQKERERKQREYQELKLERARDRERKQKEWEDRKRNRGNNRNGSSGGCYITTATCITLGKPDDCVELATIRSFRDNWLARQKDGNKTISDYYTKAPLIVAAIEKQKNFIVIYRSIWDNYLNTFFKLILANKNEEAKKVYMRMVADLTNKYVNISHLSTK